MVVEAGPVMRKDDITTDSGELLARYFWDGGLRTTRGNVFMPTLQAKVMGGGSVVNSAICMRTPDWIIDSWDYEHGTGFTNDDLAPHFARVEEFMKVGPTPDDIQGLRNELFKQACEELGFNWEKTLRNVAGCKGSSECFTGCRNQAKQSTDIRGIPEVIENGGRVYTSVRVDKLIMRGHRAAGVIGRVLDPSGKATHKMRITARCVVLAAGAIATPAIIQASGVKREPIGSNLRMHPGSIVLGVYDQDIVPWAGATQGYHCNDFLQEGIKLESLWVSTALVAFRMPGLASEFKNHVANYRKMASWDAWVSGADSIGRVRHMRGGRPDVTFELGNGDVRRLQEATAKLAEMQFAAGAKEVLTGLGGHLARLDNPSQANSLRQEIMTPQDFPTASNHVFGTMAMGGNPRKHACDPSGAVYEVDDLYVCDTSLFPASPAVNPMLTAMMFGDRIGNTIAERY